MNILNKNYQILYTNIFFKCEIVLMASIIQICNKTTSCKGCGSIGRIGKIFRCDKSNVLLDSFSLWIKGEIMSEIDNSDKRITVNQNDNPAEEKEEELSVIDDEIDFIVEYLEKEEKSIFQRIVKCEEDRLKRTFDRQMSHMKKLVQSFFQEKRKSLKVLDTRKNDVQNNPIPTNVFTERKLSIVLRHIAYEPREYEMGSLGVKDKPVKLLTLQQKEMQNCRVVRGLCVFKDKIFVIKWMKIEPTISVISTYDLNGTFIENLSKNTTELTAIEVRNDGNFYIADMSTNFVLISKDCINLKHLFQVAYPQGIAICSDGLIIACDDPHISEIHKINMYKYSFDGQLLYHFEDNFRSLYKVCTSGTKIISTHDQDNGILILDTVTGEKTTLILDKNYTPIGACSLPNESFAIANYGKKCLTIYDSESCEICQINLIVNPVQLAFYENNNYYYLICQLFN